MSVPRPAPDPADRTPAWSPPRLRIHPAAGAALDNGGFNDLTASTVAAS